MKNLTPSIIQWTEWPTGVLVGAGNTVAWDLPNTCPILVHTKNQLLFCLLFCRTEILVSLTH